MQKRLFEIEIHNYCNRKCVWCPNKEIDRQNYYDELDEDIYLSVLNYLKENNYNGAISYSRYNEPMSKPNLFKKRVKQAKQMLPDVKLVSNTNGDYLSKENLDGLMIDELTVMDYDCKGKQKVLKKLMYELNAFITSIDYPIIKAKYKSMNILYYLDWLKHVELEDRGGTLDKIDKHKDIDLKWKNDASKRTEPCYEPTYFVGIDFNGDVVPCCHIRGDNPQHRKYVYGNLHVKSIEDILGGDKHDRIVSDVCKGNLLNPCENCHKSPGRYTKYNPGIGYKIK